MKAKRINVTIPAVVAERLQLYKDDINVSRVCAEALDRELQRLECKPVEASELQELINRFQAQADQAEMVLYRLQKSQRRRVDDAMIVIPPAFDERALALADKMGRRAAEYANKYQRENGDGQGAA